MYSLGEKGSPTTHQRTHEMYSLGDKGSSTTHRRTHETYSLVRETVVSVYKSESTV